MKMLSNIIRGRSERPHFVMLYGVDGVGKSSWAAAAPNPIFLGPEDGLGFLDVARFPAPGAWADIKAAVGDLLNEKHDFKTLAIDSVDWLEPMVWGHVCAVHGVTSIEDVDGGWGKGYTKALEQWKELLNMLARLRHKMNVIAIGHCQIKTFDDPHAGEKFDRYQLKLNEKASALWREAVDCVLFANFVQRVSKVKGSVKARAFGDGSRVMYTERRPAFDAKNRFNLPFELPLDWKAFEDAVKAAASVGDTSAQQVIDLVGDKAEAAVAFLVRHEWIEEGQTLASLPPERVRSILANPARFLAAISEQPKTQETNE